MVNAYLEPFLLTGAPDPLAEHVSGTHATVSRRGQIAVTDGSHRQPWTLVADARWPDRRRLYATPWVVAALTADEDLLVLNLARVDRSGLPKAMVRSLELQAQQFCSTPLQQWAKTATTKARFTHDGHIEVGGYRIAAPTPLETNDGVFAAELAKTFHDLSGKRRQIALLLQIHDGLTLDQLTNHFAGPDASGSARRAARAALHVELTRMRQHPRIALERNADGRYTISRIEQDELQGRALAR